MRRPDVADSLVVDRLAGALVEQRLDECPRGTGGTEPPDRNRPVEAILDADPPCEHVLAAFELHELRPQERLPIESCAVEQEELEQQLRTQVANVPNGTGEPAA